MPQIELVLTIGLYAQAWHLGSARRGSLTETVRELAGDLSRATSRRACSPLPHPSWRNTGWLKQNPWFETDLLPFLRTEIRDRIDAVSAQHDTLKIASCGEFRSCLRGENSPE